jgi:hypothetical protein
MTGFLILFGGMALVVTIVGTMDLMGRRQERLERLGSKEQG